MELKEQTLTGADLMRSSRSKLEEWLVNYQRRSRETMRKEAEAKGHFCTHFAFDMYSCVDWVSYMSVFR